VIILRKIGVIGLSVLFLFLSTGVMLYQTHCECLGSSGVSLFAAHELSDHSASECDCCSIESKPAIPYLDSIQQECGCVPPIVIYLKLSSHSGDDSTLEYSLAKKITLQNIAVIETVEQLLPEKLFVHFTNYEPPLTKKVGRTLVNFLKQYKIALFA
jgi:hypothetical protein